MSRPAWRRQGRGSPRRPIRSTSRRSRTRPAATASSSAISSSVPMSARGTCSASAGSMPKAGPIWPASAAASSVTMTKPMSELSSRSAKRSPAASFTQPIFVRVRSGVASAAVSAPPVPSRRLTLMLTMSAWRAAKDSTRLPAPADDERGPGLLHGTRRQGVAQHLVVLAVEVERPVGSEQALHHLHGLFEARHAHGRVVVGQPGLVVVGAHPAGTEAHFEATVAQHVERGRLLGQHEGVPVVVAEDQRAHAERGGGGGHRGQGRHGRQLVAEVVGHEQRAVAEVLGLAGLRGPRAGGAVRCLAELRGEAEFAVVCHGAMLPHFRAPCALGRLRRGSRLRSQRGVGLRPEQHAASLLRRAERVGEQCRGTGRAGLGRDDHHRLRLPLAQLGPHVGRRKVGDDGAWRPPHTGPGPPRAADGWPPNVLAPSGPGITAKPPGIRKFMSAMACHSMASSFVELASG